MNPTINPAEAVGAALTTGINSVRVHRSLRFAVHLHSYVVCLAAAMGTLMSATRNAKAMIIFPHSLLRSKSIFISTPSPLRRRET